MCSIEAVAVALACSCQTRPIAPSAWCTTLCRRYSQSRHTQATFHARSQVAPSHEPASYPQRRSSIAAGTAHVCDSDRVTAHVTHSREQPWLSRLACMPRREARANLAEPRPPKVPARMRPSRDPRSTLGSAQRGLGGGAHSANTNRGSVGWGIRTCLHSLKVNSRSERRAPLPNAMRTRCRAASACTTVPTPYKCSNTRSPGANADGCVT